MAAGVKIIMNTVSRMMQRSGIITGLTKYWGKQASHHVLPLHASYILTHPHHLSTATAHNENSATIQNTQTHSVPTSPAATTASTSSTSTSSPLPAPSSSSSPPSDAGAEFVFHSMPPLPRTQYSKWPFRFFIIACAVAYYLEYSSKRDAIINKLHRDIISCVPTEVQELIPCLNLTTRDLESIYENVMRRYPRGHVTMDQFSAIVAEQAEIIRARRATARDQRHTARLQSRYNRERVEVELEILHDEQRDRWDEKEYMRVVEENRRLQRIDDNQEQIDRDEHTADTHKSNTFNPIDLFLFLRTQSNAYTYDIKALCYALSQLIHEHVELRDRYADRIHQGDISALSEYHQRAAEWNRDLIEVYTRENKKKIEFAWRVMDEDRDGCLTYGEMLLFFHYMITTGHIQAESLIHTQPSTAHYLYPVHFTIKTLEELVRLYSIEMEQKQWENYNRNIEEEERRRKEGVGKINVVHPPAPFSWHTKLPYSDFLHISHTLSHLQLCKFWYMTPIDSKTGQGLSKFQAWRLKWRLRIKRQWTHIDGSFDSFDAQLLPFQV